MGPEQVLGSVFYTEVGRQAPIKKTETLRSLPRATASFVREIRDYRRVFHGATDGERQYLQTGPAMLLSLWGYTQVSGRSITQLHRDGVLLPAAALYKTLVTQDDILDSKRIEKPATKARQAFWYTDDPNNLPPPRESFRFAIGQINNNLDLAYEAKRYMGRKIAFAYRNYVVAEDALSQMARDGNYDLYNTHTVLAGSFGLMTKALTAVLNGNTSQTEQAQQAEDQMAWFELAATIVDGELDKEEDAPYTVTLPIVADNFDSNVGNQQGETTEKLLNYYLSNLSSPRVSSVVRTARYLYPRLEKLLYRLDNKSLFTRASLKHDSTDI